MKNSMEVPPKIKNRVTIWSSNPSSGYLCEKSDLFIRYMYSHVHCSIIHGGQDMETIKVSFDRWLDKEDAVCIYYGTLFSHEKRWNTAICDNMDGSWEYHAIWNKSDRKSQETYEFTQMG